MGTPLVGASNAGGIGRNHDCEPISGLAASCQRCDRGYVLSTRRCRTVTSYDTTAGSKRRPFLFTGDVDEMCMTRSLNVSPKTTEQHLIARSDKSVACVTNNKSLHLTFCTPMYDFHFFSCVSLNFAWWLLSCEIVLLCVFAVFLQFDSSVFLSLFSLLTYYISVNKDYYYYYWS